MLRIRYERLRRGWSQEQLGRLSHIHQPVIAYIELGRVLPSDDELTSLARALGISPPSVLLKPVTVHDPDEAVAS